MLTVLALIAGLYVLLAAGLFLAQRSFIYPVLRDPGVAPASFERVAYETADGLTLHAGYKPARAGYPTIVYFHGNGAAWPSSVVATDRMVPEGYGVLAAEYRGYCGNPGRPSEHGLYVDGRAAIAFLERREVEPADIVLVGNSIGSGVATQMATEIRPRALVLISPFASLSRLVGERFRWLPTDVLLHDRFENIGKIAAVDAPILVLHGDADSLIPASHAFALAEAEPSIELAIFAGYGHDLAWHDVAETRMLRFLDEIPGALADPEPQAGGDARRVDVRPGDHQPQRQRDEP